MTTTELPETITLAYPKGLPHAHVQGCRAASRGTHPADPPIAFPFATLVEIVSDPDEGEIKVCACLRPAVRAAQKAAVR